MGVSGSGKSTVGRALAERLGWDFAEGDELHPPENVAKMAAGMPLTDADRRPWLERIADWIRDERAQGRDGVVTCSALKREYRGILAVDGVRFVYLRGTVALIHQRLQQRTGHFMPASLLGSQLDTLEEPAADEDALPLDVDRSPDELVDEIVAWLG